ncbi:hypothetical protein D3C85_1428110 [compost metagenome]
MLFTRIRLLDCFVTNWLTVSLALYSYGQVILPHYNVYALIASCSSQLRIPSELNKSLRTPDLKLNPIYRSLS